MREKVGLRDLDWTVRVPVFFEWARIILTAAFLVFALVLVFAK